MFLVAFLAKKLVVLFVLVVALFPFTSSSCFFSAVFVHSSASPSVLCLFFLLEHLCTAIAESLLF